MFQRLNIKHLSIIYPHKPLNFMILLGVIFLSMQNQGMSQEINSDLSNPHIAVVQGATLLLPEEDPIEQDLGTPSPFPSSSFQRASSIMGNGHVIVEPGGVVSPGSSPGIHYHNGRLSITGGSTWIIDLDILDSTEGVGWDLIDVSGRLDFDASPSSLITIMLFSAEWLDDFDASKDYTEIWNIATANTIRGFNANHFIIDTQGFQASLGDGYFYLSQSSNTIYLNFSKSSVMVPEPSRVMLLMIMGTSFLFQRRR